MRRMLRYRCIVQGGQDTRLIAVFVFALNAYDAMALAIAKYGDIIAFASRDE